jgi:hypothetical protein
MDSEADDPRKYNSGRVFAGIAILLAGLAMLADQTGLRRFHVSAHYWPLILVALGVTKAIDPSGRDGRRRSRRGGVWLVYVGCWGLVNEFHLFGLDYGSSWPLLVIGSGLVIVWRALEGPSAPRMREN